MKREDGESVIFDRLFNTSYLIIWFEHESEGNTRVNPEEKRYSMKRMTDSLAVLE